MEKYKVLDFKIFGDDRGALTALESNKDIPFDIKRIFYIYDTSGKGVVRGDHANRKTKFVLVMVSGSCKIKIYNHENNTQEVIMLDKPNKGLFLDNMLYKEMYDFSDGSIMLVLASEFFDAEEYIDSYEDLLKELGND